jgi:hypothetical protein
VSGSAIVLAVVVGWPRYVHAEHRQGVHVSGALLAVLAGEAPPHSGPGGINGTIAVLRALQDRLLAGEIVDPGKARAA